MSFLYLVIIAVALSLDAFSISLSLGREMSDKQIFLLSTSIGLLHAGLPFFGALLGFYIKKVIIDMNIFSSIIFFYLAFSNICEKENKSFIINKILIISISVSIDSFLVGISLDQNIFMAMIIFSVITFSFSYIGLIISRYLNKIYGKKFNYLSFLILLILALMHLYKFIAN